MKRRSERAAPLARPKSQTSGALLRIANESHRVSCPINCYIITFTGEVKRSIAGVDDGRQLAVSEGSACCNARERCVLLLARTENWRSPLGKALETIGSVAVLVLGAWPLIHRFVF